MFILQGPFQDLLQTLSVNPILFCHLVSCLFLEAPELFVTSVSHPICVLIIAYN